ncbi:MAG: alpha/beta hydrolase [Actinomycetota bacterium]|nr:alpha/beta hydrolase [Actinomycetota bacterium]
MRAKPDTEQRRAGDAARSRLVAATTAAERRLDLAGTSTAVLEAGDGPPIVFLQGEFAEVWVRVFPGLKRTHRVIAADLPGLGASTAPTGRLDADTVLTWLDQLIEKTCAGAPTLVGKGLGGAAATRFAARHSNRLERLVLVDSLGLGRFRPPPGMALTFLAVLLRPTERTLERSFRNYCFVDLDEMRREMGEVYQWVADYAVDRFRTPSVRTSMRHLMKTFGSAIPPEDLTRITVPTTLIWGRHDVGAPLEIAEAASDRYGWPLHIIEDARDDPGLERPDEFLHALATAIAATEGSSAR